MTIKLNILSKIAGIALLSLALLAFSISANAEEGVVSTATPAGVVSAGTETPTVPAVKTTLDNLMAAYNGESNANARYLAFAQKADEEGYGQVASLFRAAARAEQVHLERHAEVIKELGGEAKANVEAPVIKTTKENIEASFNGEVYENTVMYPEFVVKATADNIANAVDAFEDAQKAEGVHAQLYKQALDNLDMWKGAKKDFFVCPKCGNVVETLPEAVCPICDTAKEKFMPIS